MLRRRVCIFEYYDTSVSSITSGGEILAFSVRTRSSGAGKPPRKNVARMEPRRVRLQERIQGINATFPKVPTVTPKQTQQMLAQSVPLVLVDCRSAEERRVSMLRPDAITERQFDEQRDSLIRDGTTVIAYCTIGYRSAQFVSKHMSSGIPMYNLSGSILAWIDDGYDIWGNEDTGYDHTTRDIHVWSKEFAAYVPPDDYKPRYFRHPLLHMLFNH